MDKKNLKRILVGFCIAVLMSGVVPAFADSDSAAEPVIQEQQQPAETAAAQEEQQPAETAAEENTGDAPADAEAGAPAAETK